MKFASAADVADQLHDEEVQAYVCKLLCITEEQYKRTMRIATSKTKLCNDVISHQNKGTKQASIMNFFMKPKQEPTEPIAASSSAVPVSATAEPIHYVKSVPGASEVTASAVERVFKKPRVETPKVPKPVVKSDKGKEKVLSTRVTVRPAPVEANESEDEGFDEYANDYADSDSDLMDITEEALDIMKDQVETNKVGKFSTEPAALFVPKTPFGSMQKELKGQSQDRLFELLRVWQSDAVRVVGPVMPIGEYVVPSQKALDDLLRRQAYHQFVPVKPGSVGSFHIPAVSRVYEERYMHAAKKSQRVCGYGRKCTAIEIQLKWCVQKLADCVELPEFVMPDNESAYQKGERTPTAGPCVLCNRVAFSRFLFRTIAYKRTATEDDWRTNVPHLYRNYVDEIGEYPAHVMHTPPSELNTGLTWHFVHHSASRLRLLYTNPPHFIHTGMDFPVASSIPSHI